MMYNLDSVEWVPYSDIDKFKIFYTLNLSRDTSFDIKITNINKLFYDFFKNIEHTVWFCVEERHDILFIVFEDIKEAAEFALIL